MKKKEFKGKEKELWFVEKNGKTVFIDFQGREYKGAELQDIISSLDKLKYFMDSLEYYSSKKKGHSNK